MVVQALPLPLDQPQSSALVEPVDLDLNLDLTQLVPKMELPLLPLPQSNPLLPQTVRPSQALFEAQQSSVVVQEVQVPVYLLQHQVHHHLLQTSPMVLQAALTALNPLRAVPFPLSPLVLPVQLDLVQPQLVVELTRPLPQVSWPSPVLPPSSCKKMQLDFVTDGGK